MLEAIFTGLLVAVTLTVVWFAGLVVTRLVRK